MEELKDKILKGASDLFHRYGVRSVSMDDLARSLSISKKTIYQYYTDKDEIVALAVQLHIAQAKQEYDEVFNTAENPVQELQRMSACMRKNFKDLNPGLLFDIQKFHPEAWKHFSEFKLSYIRNQIESNLKRGMEQGYYRKNLNIQVMSVLRLGEVEMAFDPTVFPPDTFDFRETQIQLLDHFIQGIVTDEGRQLFDKYNQEQQQL
jgi:AcrR family transcriptional regulator